MFFVSECGEVAKQTDIFIEIRKVPVEEEYITLGVVLESPVRFKTEVSNKQHIVHYVTYLRGRTC